MWCQRTSKLSEPNFLERKTIEGDSPVDEESMKTADKRVTFPGLGM